jgi:hypothetical protein
MCRACSIHGSYEKCIQGFGWKTWRDDSEACYVTCRLNQSSPNRGTSLVICCIERFLIIFLCPSECHNLSSRPPVHQPFGGAWPLFSWIP